MSFVPLGSATIDGNVTPIRKYDNGFFVVETNYDVRYSAETLEELRKQLYADNVKHNIVQDGRDDAAEQ